MDEAAGGGSVLVTLIDTEDFAEDFAEGIAALGERRLPASRGR